MASKSIFRAEVHQSAERARLGRIVLVRPLSFTFLTVAAGATCLLVLAFLAMAEYAKKASVQGALVPAAGAIRVVAHQAGTLQGRRLVEGERVEAGEELFRLTEGRATTGGLPLGNALDALSAGRALDLDRQRRATHAGALAEIRSLERRLVQLEADREEQQHDLDRLGERGRLVAERAKRFATLEASGFVSTAQRQQADEEALEQDSRFGAARRTRLAIERDIATTRGAIEEAHARHRSQLAAIDGQVAALEQARLERAVQSDSRVEAPASGLVAAVLAEPGQPVASGAPLLTVLPEGSPLEAHLYAPSRAIGFVRKGQEVRLRYPAFPFQKFGSHRGRVVSVSRQAHAPGELGFAPPDNSREPLYRIKVALDSQAVTAYGRPEPLQAGMQVEADVLLDRRRLLEWLFDPLVSLAGRQ
jgi:membrane fusion protein